MTRFFIAVVMIATAALLVAPAWAAVPYPPNCTVVWNKASYGDDSVVVVCPKGDASYFDVTVIDQFGSPMAGQTVYVTVTPDAVPRLVLGGVLTGLTNVAGYCRVGIKAGCLYSTPLYDPHGAGFLAGGVTVTCMAVVLFQDASLKYYLSPDSNGNQKVQSDDGLLFGNDWQFVLHNGHSNYNRIGAGTQNITNSADGLAFSAHWQHQ